MIAKAELDSDDAQQLAAKIFAEDTLKFLQLNSEGEHELDEQTLSGRVLNSAKSAAKFTPKGWERLSLLVRKSVRHFKEKLHKRAKNGIIHSDAAKEVAAQLHN